MPYVMVPVPAEHEEELMQEVLKLAIRKDMAAWNADDLASFVDQAEPSWVELLRYLVSCAQQRRRPTGAEISEATEIDEYELMDLGRAINQRCQQRGWPALVLAQRVETPAPDGRVESMYLGAAAVSGLGELLDVAVPDPSGS